MSTIQLPVDGGNVRRDDAYGVDVGIGPDGVTRIPVATDALGNQIIVSGPPPTIAPDATSLVESPLFRVKAGVDPNGNSILIRCDSLGRQLVTLPPGQVFPTVGTTPGTVAAGDDSRILPTFTPEMFGATGDGVTNDTARVQAAVNAAITNGGRVLLGKTYLVSSTITGTGNITIEGLGTILCNFAVGDILHFAPTSAPASGTGGTLADTDGLQHLTFRDFQIQSTVLRTSGAAIYVQYGFNPLFEHLIIGKFDIAAGDTLPHYDGIYCSRTANPRILNNDIRCHHKAILFSGGIGQNEFQFDGLIQGNEIWGSFVSGSVAIHIGGDTGGCNIGPNNLSQFEQLLLVDTSLESATNRELFIYGHCFWDSFGLYGIHVVANSLIIFRVSDLWVAGGGRMASGAAGGNVGVAVYLEAQATGFKAAFNGGHIYACTGHGFRLSGVQATITGVTVEYNGTGTAQGVGVRADGGTVVTITGGEITGNPSQVDVTGAYLAILSGVNMVSSGSILSGTPTAGLYVTGCAGINDTPRTYLSGNVTVNGQVATQGVNAAFFFTDRTSNANWYLYADTGLARILTPNGANITFDPSGNVTAPAFFGDGSHLTGIATTSTFAFAGLVYSPSSGGTPAAATQANVVSLLTGGSGTLNLSGYTLGLTAGQIPAIPESGVANLVSDLALKAPLASPAFTGTPTVPTATVGTNTTQAASTAFVTGGLSGKAASGANSDITSATALTAITSTTALTLSAGGSNQSVTLTPSGTGTILIAQNGGTNRTVSFGTGAGAGAMFLYDGGVTGRYGFGVMPANLQFFIPTNGSAYSWNKGGDLQSVGTNELMRLFGSGGLGIGITTDPGAGNVSLAGRLLAAAPTTYTATLTAAGTTGAQTISKPSGTVRIAAAGTSVVVTNTLCTSTSLVYAVCRTNDATAYVKNCVPASGSFTINLGAAATAETEIQWFVNGTQ